MKIAEKNIHRLGFLLLLVALLVGCETADSGGGSATSASRSVSPTSSESLHVGTVRAWKKKPDSLQWGGRVFYSFNRPGDSRSVQVERHRYIARKDTRIAGQRLAEGQEVYTVNLRGDSSRWIVPPSAEIKITGPIAWVKESSGDETFDRVDMRTGQREPSPVTTLRFIVDNEPPFWAPNRTTTGRFFARTLGMDPGQWGMVDDNGEIVRLIRDIDEIRPQVLHDHATMLAMREENPYVSFLRTRRPNEDGFVTDFYRTLADRPIQPLRGGGVVVRHHTPAMGVFWSVYAADGSVTIPATSNLVSILIPVIEDRSTGRTSKRYIAYLLPLPGHDQLYWPILDDGTLLEADGLVGIRPFNGILGPKHKVFHNEETGLGTRWFDTASLWEIGGERLWAIQPDVTNSKKIAEAIGEAFWRDWEQIEARGKGGFGAYFPVAQTILTDISGQFRLWGEDAVYATINAARNAVQAKADEIEQEYAAQRRNLEEAKRKNEERARAAAQARWERQQMLRDQPWLAIKERVAQIEREGARTAGDVAFFRSHVKDQARVQAVSSRYWQRYNLNRPAPATTRSSANWGTRSFNRSYGMSAMERESRQFQSWIAQREAWNRAFDQRWGFDRR